MTALRAWLGGRFRGDRGAGLIQYGLLVIGIAVVALVAIQGVGATVGAMYESSGDSITAPP